MGKTQAEIKKSVGRRIKYLRQFHGETRENLAESIAVSVDTLKKYEQGQRSPSDEILTLIANRYGLESIDFVPDPLEGEPIPLAVLRRDVDEVYEAFEDAVQLLFPVFCPDGTKMSSSMEEAVRCHQELMDGFGANNPIGKINACLKLYRESICSDDDEAISIANRISLLMLGEHFSATSRASRDLEELPTERLCDTLLANAKIKFKLQSELDGIAETKKEHIQELIERLYKHPLTRFSEIGHYFTALSVCLGLNQYVGGVSMREVTGLNMMTAIGIAGNEYAMDYLLVALGPYLEDD